MPMDHKTYHLTTKERRPLTYDQLQGNNIDVHSEIYSKLPLNRIRDKTDLQLRNNQAGFHRGRNCAQQIHTLR